jgi:hypothetical protein
MIHHRFGQLSQQTARTGRGAPAQLACVAIVAVSAQADLHAYIYQIARERAQKLLAPPAHYRQLFASWN